MAEHHARRRQELLGAAEDLLALSGVAAVTPAAVGARAGLARSSVYTYFASTEELIAAIVESAVPVAAAELAAATSVESTPTDQVKAYLSAAIDLAARGVHRTAAALADANLPPPCQARLAELHALQRQPLRDAIAALGVADAELTTALIDGLLLAGMRAVTEGAPAAAVKAEVLRLTAGAISDYIK